MHSEYDIKIEEAGYSINPRKADIKSRSANGAEYWFYLRVAGQVGYAVAVPLVIGALVGRSIDIKFGSYPKATVWGIFIGLFISFVTFTKIVKEIIQKRE